MNMVNASRVLAASGFLLIILAIILKLGQAPLIIVARSVSLTSLLILANTSLLLAIFFKR